MSLTHYSFLFCFLPLALIVWYLVPRENSTARGGILLIFSLLFALLVQPLSALVVLAVSAVCFVLGRLMENGNAKTKKAWLCLGLALLIGQLCVFKYTAFFAENLSAILQKDIKIPTITTPVGVSSFTFLAVGYLVDVYKGAGRKEKNPAKLTLYFTLFPRFLQGPLTRYDALEAQLYGARAKSENFAHGIERIIGGLGKKVLLANALSLAVAEVFSAPAQLTALQSWLGAIIYAWQIYFDFSGYTDMAIGLAMLFGIRLSENFRHPYMAQSVTDFWRRWHITLSTWFRDYVYIPLGGNRKGLARQLLNLLIVWLLTGLWHGASWNFVLWGLFFAVLLMLEKAFLGKIIAKMPRFLRHFYALCCILVGWVIFRSENLTNVGLYISAMLTGGIDKMADGSFIRLLFSQYGIEMFFAAILSTTLGARLDEKLRESKLGNLARAMFLLAVFALSLLALTNSSMNAFVYAQF